MGKRRDAIVEKGRRIGVRRPSFTHTGFLGQDISGDGLT
jgi:hypothetical protein